MERPIVSVACSVAVILLLPLFASVSALLATESDTYSHTLTSDRVNGVHEDLEVDIAPIELGPLVIQLRAPSYSFEVLEHELQLGAVGEGVDAGRLQARFKGKAYVVAEFGVGDVTSEIDDNIELPLQEVDLGGRVELVREGDGYRVTALEIPSYLEIQMESDLAGQLDLLCRGFSVMALGAIDCDALDQALTRVKLPLPEPGRQFFISSSDLTPHELQQVEAYFAQRAD
jgi:hypothetical protein